MIISGGANIYPAEIENALITSPLVYDCCVFGIPNEEWGEEIKAAVQLREGVPESKETIAQLLSYLEERLARMKLPKSFDFHAELPRDPNGKIYKRNLRAPYWQGKVRNV
jgi:long-chain acyl-CoA synthetase